MNPLPSSSSPTPSSSEAVYTKLIQTYLNLLCYDNATFLAERNAASFPHSEQAIYLLAYCYYRSGNVKGARSVLVTRWIGRKDFATANKENIDAVNSSEGDGSNDVEAERTHSAARYLLSKCCYDLALYGEAEETLLRPCRERFAQAVVDGNGTVNGVKIRGNRNEAMDAWIIQTTTSSGTLYCPIPNGSAGLYLLGNICRKTNRRQRAIEYYRLSLKLDPLLWTAYEAICELGGAEGKVDEADDPMMIFGVDAPTLSPRHGDVMMMGGGGHGFERSGVDDSNNVGDASTVGGDGQQSLYSFQLNRHGTPSTPYSGFGKMNIGAYTNTTATTADADKLRQQQQQFRATASTVAPRTRGRKTGDGLPQTNLFAATPGVASTAAAYQQDESANAETPMGGETPAGQTETTPKDDTVDASTPPSSAIGYANQVLDRARRVVAGLTYEPSPEQPSFVNKGATERRARFANELTFSTTPLPSSATTTPHHGSGNTDGTSPFHVAGVSTVKGGKEKRALSFSTHEKEASVSKKTPKKEERKKEEMTQTQLSEEGKEEAAAAEMPLEGLQQLDLEEIAESEHVCKVLQLLCGLGAAYKYLCQFRSEDALELFRELPSEHMNTGWVQHQIGKAYFEMSDYQNAQRALLTMQKVEPHRIKGLDILSTTLWQLKKEVELSDLAQQVVDFDRMAPESWFVVGNCFSLQKEHETAITFFRRAIQLNPSFTYAHTLCGHEFTSNEDFEKAICCYRDAIRVDSRHYNAWYGLGAIFFRQEKFDLAEYHFQRALDINSQSSVLHCHLGMAQHQNGKTLEALDTLAGAFRLDPRNPQAHYQRATIFMTLDRPEDALSELEKVRSAAPKEASVHFNMGKVYKRLGQPAKAMRCFLTALDLDPKDNNLIKAAMDRLDEPDVEESGESVF